MSETSSETDVSTALRRMLRDDEVLFWHYRPPRGLYVRQRLVSTVLVDLVLVTIFCLFVALPALTDFSDLIESMLGMSAPVAIVLGWVVAQVIWFVAVMLASYSAYDRIEFAAWW